MEGANDRPTFRLCSFVKEFMAMTLPLSPLAPEVRTSDPAAAPFALLADARTCGAKAALLMIPTFDGGAPRPVGAAMAVLEDGHDWETETALLARTPEAGGFCVGALSSPKTHRLGCENLARIGVAQDLIARIYGPIGIIERARDPGTLALSILEVFGRARMDMEQQ